MNWLIDTKWVNVLQGNNLWADLFSLIEIYISQCFTVSGL